MLNCGFFTYWLLRAVTKLCQTPRDVIQAADAAWPDFPWLFPVSKRFLQLARHKYRLPQRPPHLATQFTSKPLALCVSFTFCWAQASNGPFRFLSHDMGWEWSFVGPDSWIQWRRPLHESPGLSCYHFCLTSALKTTYWLCSFLPEGYFSFLPSFFYRWNLHKYVDRLHLQCSIAFD